MFADITKSFDQLFSGTFWAVTLKTLLLTVPLLALAIWAGFELVEAIPATGWGWLDKFISWLGGAAAIVLGLILFPSLSQMVMGIFLDDIAEAVEKKHYSGDPPGREVGMMKGAVQGLRLGALTLVVNVLLLPVYLIFLFFPVLSLALYYLVNGWLLNREYFELVATRHGDATSHKRLRRKSGGKLFTAGCAIAFVFTVPIVNLLASAWATAFMVHVFKRVEGASNAAAA